VPAGGRESGAGQKLAFRLRPLTQADAEAIASWHYPEPYSLYDWTAEPADLAELLDPALRGDAYVAAEDEAGALAGYFSFKPTGDRVWVGLGLHPDRTGQGLGQRFVGEGLAYARRTLSPELFALRVASFNRRAITVYERCGFTRVRTFMHATNGGDWEFVEMTRPA
jgi:ribosomal-protein-alanine N-acetyltransferase